MTSDESRTVMMSPSLFTCLSLTSEPKSEVNRPREETRRSLSLTSVLFSSLGYSSAWWTCLASSPLTSPPLRYGPLRVPFAGRYGERRGK